MADLDSTAALGTLADALDLRDFDIIRPAIASRRPCLTIACRHARMSEKIYAAHGWYWWSWGERISPITESDVAAGKIARVLRVVPSA
jgi:hypothetical protein